MEFSGQYLTYQEYLALGGTLNLMPFNLLEFEARRQIDLKTFNRLVDQEDIPQEVKMCVYNLINEINGYRNTTTTISASGNIAGENIDGYSINYITPNQISDIVKSMQEEIEDTIRTYLLNVIYHDEHLMYVGVDQWLQIQV